MTDDHRIESLDDVAKFAEIVDVSFRQTVPRPHSYWFRGHSDPRFALTPTAFRNEQCWKNAHHIATEFRARGSIRKLHEVPGWSGSCFEWLSLMRHYGAPNCLLDWTRSLFVAVFFACKGPHPANRDEQESAHLIAFDPMRFMRDAPFSEFHGPVQDAASHVFIAPPTVHGMSNPKQIDRNCYLPIVPRESSLRMMVQNSVFTLHRNTCPLDEIDYGDCLVRGIITKKGRERIAETCKALGITDSELNPDLGDLAQELSHRYSI